MASDDTAGVSQERDRSFWTGLPLACALAAAFLLITAYQSLATFFLRMYASDVMLGAVTNFSFLSRSTLDVATFVAGLILVHGFFAVVIHTLAYLTSVAVPAAAQSRQGLVVIWFGLLVAAVLMQNAEWFPRTSSGAYYHEIATALFLGISFAQSVVFSVAVIGILVTLAAAVRTMRSATLRSAQFSAITTVVAALMIGVMAAVGNVGNSTAASASAVPNVVILGVDSLRLEQLRRFGGSGNTPNLDAALAGADLFSDTITPLARTFPAWVSILTGRAPRSTGATFNLIHRPDVASSPTLGNMLGNLGYQTYYATDEVRFSNIDESYGFDRVITPPIGAADFLVGRAADLPLSNVVANTRLGAAFLGYLHGNRGVADLYRPSTFLARIRDEFKPDAPVFVAIHLTAAHWPYFHADSPVAERGDELPDASLLYGEGLQTADRMFGQIMETLRAKGVLDNAILVILSDHGEALMQDEDGLVSETLDGRVDGLLSPARVLNWGHGQSVLSPAQFQVLLAFRGFGPAARLLPEAGEYDVPASLEDVLPTVLDLLGKPVSGVDGESLKPWLQGSSTDRGRLQDRIRFTETDIRVAPAADGTLDEDNAAAQAVQLLAIDKQTGWLHLRPSALPTLTRFKERAAIGRTHLLAAMPVAPDRHQYLLLDRKTGVGKVLDGRPNVDDQQSALLWDALHEHFAGELHPAVVVGPDEQALFDAQWTASLNQSPASSPGT